MFGTLISSVLSCSPNLTPNFETTIFFHESKKPMHKQVKVSKLVVRYIEQDISYAGLLFKTMTKKEFLKIFNL